MSLIRQKKTKFYFMLGIIGLLNLFIFQNFQQNKGFAIDRELRISEQEITATRLRMSEDLAQRQVQGRAFDLSGRIRRIAEATSIQDNEPVRIKLKRKTSVESKKRSKLKTGVKNKSSTPVKNKPKKKIKS